MNNATTDFHLHCWVKVIKGPNTSCDWLHTPTLWSCFRTSLATFQRQLRGYFRSNTRETPRIPCGSYVFYLLSEENVTAASVALMEFRTYPVDLSAMMAIFPFCIISEAFLVYVSKCVSRTTSLVSTQKLTRILNLPWWVASWRGFLRVKLNLPWWVASWRGFLMVILFLFSQRITFLTMVCNIRRLSLTPVCCCNCC